MSRKMGRDGLPVDKWAPSEHTKAIMATEAFKMGYEMIVSIICWYPPVEHARGVMQFEDISVNYLKGTMSVDDINRYFPGLDYSKVCIERAVLSKMRTDSRVRHKFGF